MCLSSLVTMCFGRGSHKQLPLISPQDKPSSQLDNTNITFSNDSYSIFGVCITLPQDDISSITNEAQSKIFHTKIANKINECTDRFQLITLKLLLDVTHQPPEHLTDANMPPEFSLAGESKLKQELENFRQDTELVKAIAFARQSSSQISDIQADANSSFWYKELILAKEC